MISSCTCSHLFTKSKVAHTRAANVCVSRSVKMISSSNVAHLFTKSKASEKDGIPTSVLDRWVEAI